MHGYVNEQSNERYMQHFFFIPLIQLILKLEALGFEFSPSGPRVCALS